MMSVGYKFSVWTSTWRWPPVHRRPPELDPLPLHVDVINGWPLKQRIYIVPTQQAHLQQESIPGGGADNGEWATLLRSSSSIRNPKLASMDRPLYSFHY